MATPRHTITCTKKELVAPGVYELRCTKPATMQFTAGQFLLFDVPLLQDPTDIQPRAYSIASTPDEDDLLFCIKLKEGGRASQWIVDVLQVGTEVSVVGPLGLFTVKENADTLVFIATGAGLAPLRSQAKYALEHGDTRTMHLIFGVRDVQDFFWREDLQMLADAYPQFSLHLTLSGDAAGWDGLRGRVQTILPSLSLDPAKTSIYICGAPAMVNDVKTYCMDTLHIEKAKVHAEGYI